MNRAFMTDFLQLRWSSTGVTLSFVGVRRPCSHFFSLSASIVVVTLIATIST